MVAPLSQLPLKWQLAGRRLTVSPDLREALGTFQMESRRGADHKMELPKQAMVDKNRPVFFSNYHMVSNVPCVLRWCHACFPSIQPVYVPDSWGKSLYKIIKHGYSIRNQQQIEINMVLSQSSSIWIWVYLSVTRWIAGCKWICFRVPYP